MVHRVPACGFAAAYIIAEKDGLLVRASIKIQKFITGVLGRRLDEVQALCATHFHIDHIAGIPSLLEKCSPSTQVIFHGKVKEYLDGTSALSPMCNWVSGLVPAVISSWKYAHNPINWSIGLHGIPVPLLNRIKWIGYRDRISYQGGTGSTGSPFFGTWEIIETPGHTEDSISFYNRPSGDLICGDLILNFEENGKGQLNRFYWNSAVLMDTFQKLKDRISPTKIYPGHGEPISSSGNALLEVEPI